MLSVSDATFPRLYAQATQAARKAQTLFLSLVAANILLMGAPAAVDMLLMSAEHGEKSSGDEHHDAASEKDSKSHSTVDLLLAIDRVLVVLAGTTTLCVLFLPFRNDWLNCRRLSESLKNHSWRYIVRAQPYSGADEDAQELLRKAFLSLASEHKHIAGSVSSEKVENKDFGELQTAREASLNERIAAYKEFRVKDQISYYSAKAADFQAKHNFFSVVIIVLQIVTFLCLSMSNSIELITKSVALCIAASIGFLGWRDFRKYDEQSASFGAAAQRLSILSNRAESISSESEFRSFVNSVEALLTKEQKLWLLKANEELQEEEESLSHSRVVGRFRQKPIEVTAVRVDEKTKVQTLEGEEEATSGDWIITGSKGEQWPVGSAVFAKKYKAVPGKADRFRKLPVEVEAVQMNSSFNIETKWGKQSGSPGDWIVFTDPHDSYICKGDIFDTTYERIIG